jgi:hypothetical protein
MGQPSRDLCVCGRQLYFTDALGVVLLLSYLVPVICMRVSQEEEEEK